MQALFLHKQRNEIIQRTRTPMSLADALLGDSHIDHEIYSKIEVKLSDQGKMREIYKNLNNNDIKVYVYDWLRKKEPELIGELEKKSRRESDEVFCDIDYTNKQLDLKILNTMAKVEEYVSHPENNQFLAEKLRMKLAPGEMEALAKILRSKRPKHSLCLTPTDVGMIRKNKELQSFLNQNSNVKFPTVVYSLCFENDPDVTSANNCSHMDISPEMMNHEDSNDKSLDDSYSSGFESHQSLSTNQSLSHNEEKPCDARQKEIFKDGACMQEALDGQECLSEGNISKNQTFEELQETKQTPQTALQHEEAPPNNLKRSETFIQQLGENKDGTPLKKTKYMEGSIAESQKLTCDAGASVIVETLDQSEPSISAVQETFSSTHLQKPNDSNYKSNEVESHVPEQDKSRIDFLFEQTALEPVDPDKMMMINYDMQREEPQDVQSYELHSFEETDGLLTSAYLDVQEPLKLVAINENMANMGELNQHFQSNPHSEDIQEKSKTHHTVFVKKMQSDLCKDSSKNPDVFLCDPCQNEPLKMKVNDGTQTKTSMYWSKTCEVTACDLLRNEPTVEVLDDALKEKAIEIQEGVSEANKDTDKEMLNTGSISEVNETEEPRAMSKAADSPSDDLQTKETFTHSLAENKRLVEQQDLMGPSERHTGASAIREALVDSAPPISGMQMFSSVSHKDLQQRKEKPHIRRSKCVQAKLKKRQDQNKMLDDWAMTQCNLKTKEELKKVIDCISIKNVIEHREYPFFVAKDIWEHKDPITGHRQIISFDQGKSKVETNTLVHYKMFVSGITQTVLLCPPTAQEIIFNEELVPVKSCLKFISEVFIPTLAVYKNIQREKNLYCLLCKQF